MPIARSHGQTYGAPREYSAISGAVYVVEEKKTLPLGAQRGDCTQHKNPWP